MPAQKDNRYLPYPGTPEFAWIVADRVCNPYRDADCVIFFTGRRGVGKSVNSIGLAEDVAVNIANMIGGKPSDYFTAANIKTVSRTGGMEILTSDSLLKEHAVLLIDDAQISISSRRSPTTENQIINDLVTIMRPFKAVLIFNSVFHANIDKGTRSLADFIVNVTSSNTFTKQSLMKVFTYEVSDSGKEYKKHLTWRDQTGKKFRIKAWIGTLPTPELLKAYNKMRRENSINLVHESRDRAQAQSEKGNGPNQKKNSVSGIIEANREKALLLKGQGKSMRAISRDLGLTDYQTSQCLSKV
jgi:hypothetical protein